MIKKIAFVSHRSKDIEADIHFWGDLLGLKLAKDFNTPEHEGRWVEFDTPDGKTIAVQSFSPEGSPPTLALETDDIEAEVARLKEAGVQFQGGVLDNKVCKMAFAFDPSGNMVMLHEIAPDRA